jgi:hypothetical protein
MTQGRRAGSCLLLLGIIAVLLASVACASTETKIIRAGDWQYEALDRLAQAGLLNGYPKAALSTVTDHLNRYEAAALTLRAVEGLGKAYQQQGKALELAAALGEGEAGGPVDEPGTVAPTQEAPQLPEGLNGENLERVRKLVEEFHSELVTMEGRIDYIQSVLTETQERLTKVEAERKQHQIDGYLQLRFNDDRANSGQKDFLVRNARINLRGPLGERTIYRIEMQFDSKITGSGPGSKAQLRTAEIDYLTSAASRVRMGQMVLPWGYELEWPTQELWAGERAFFMDRLFPDQRDLGLDVNYQRSPKAPKLDLGSFNGTGIDQTDNNKRQNLLARVDVPVGEGSIALSGYSGANGAGKALTRQNRDAVSARYHWGDTQFLGEFVTGQDLGHDVRGWYGQLGHPVSKRTPNLLFAKYDTYDENRAAPNDLFKRWTFGYWYNLDKATRLTLAIECRDVGKKFTEFNTWNGNRGYVQLQVVF